MMKTQMPLPIRENDEYPKCAPECINPVVWIRQLWVLSKWDTSPECLVRYVKLRRGINIIWSNSLITEDDALFSNGLTSHTAGRTTLCRMIRHLLGEPHYGTAEFELAVHLKYPEGWLVGEVLIDETPWMVCRPLHRRGPEHRAFVTKGGTLKSLIKGKHERLEFSNYLNLVETAVLEQLEIRKFPATDLNIGWSHVLPWLTRDQECRFSDLLTWRAKPTSGVPTLPSDQRNYLIRALLGFLDEEESKWAGRLKNSNKENKTTLGKRNKYEEDLRRDKDNLEARLSREINTNEIEFKIVADEIDNKIKQIEQRTKDSKEIYQKQNMLYEKALERLGEKRRAHDRIEISIENKRQALKLLSESLTQEQRRGMLSDLPRGKGFCNVPLHRAHAEGCPFAVDQVADLEDRRASSGIPQQVDQLNQEIKTLEQSHSKSSKDLQQAVRLVDRLKTRRDNALIQNQEILQDLASKQSDLRANLELLNKVKSNWSSLEAATRKLETIKADIIDARERLASHRMRQSLQLRIFSRAFQHAVRALLGRGAATSVEMSGKAIKPIINLGGDRSSAAIETIKVLAFDIAALVIGLEGHGYFPRFLIHDGPREADLMASIYRRIFLYFRELERRTTAFQYIITTTEPPPLELQRAPWLVLPALDASTPDGRFLRADL